MPPSCHLNVVNAEDSDQALIPADEAVTEMRAAAEQYCSTIEIAGSLSLYVLLSRLRIELPALYAAATQLPDTAFVSDDTGEQSLSNDMRAEIRRLLRERLSTVPSYWHVFDPFEPTSRRSDGTTTPPEPVASELWDDLSDIYDDVKLGLWLGESQASVSDVIWNWRTSFWLHWGRHALVALRAIHHLLNDGHVQPT